MESSIIDRIFVLLSLGRVKFLVYSPIAYGLGTLLANKNGEEFNIQLFFLGQICVWLVHAMTHYCNEFYDLDTDSINTNASAWTGGSKILTKGLVKPETSYYVALLLMLFAGMIISSLPGTFAQGVCLTAVFLAWEYSAPPFKLSRRRLGEATVVTVLNILTPLLGFVLQNGSQVEKSSFEPLLAAIIPCCFIQYSRMMVMNIPDRDADKMVGKHTLINYLGMELAVKVYGVLLALGYLSPLVLYWFSFAALPLRVILFFWITTGPMAVQNFFFLQENWDDPKKFLNFPLTVSTHSALCLISVTVALAFENGIRTSTHLQLFGIYLYGIIFCYNKYQAYKMEASKKST